MLHFFYFAFLLIKKKKKKKKQSRVFETGSVGLAETQLFFYASTQQNGRRFHDQISEKEYT